MGHFPGGSSGRNQLGECPSPRHWMPTTARVHGFCAAEKKKKNSPRFDKNVLFLMLVVHFVKYNFGYGREPEKELYGMSDLNRAQERGKCL